jgi:uroporphyrinogen-III synthase
VTAPLLEVRALSFATALDGVAALAFTSPNGVAAYTAATAAPDLPVFAIGKATAQAARAAGFETVLSADGALEDLVALIASHAPSLHGEVLRPGAAEPAGDIVAALAARGVRARAAAVYEAQPSDPGEALGDLLEGRTREPAAVLVHSPRAARRLAEVVGSRCLKAPAVCISAAAAEPLRAAGFETVVAAARPDEDALLARLVEVLRCGRRAAGAPSPSRRAPAGRRAGKATSRVI